MRKWGIRKLQVVLFVIYLFSQKVSGKITWEKNGRRMTLIGLIDAGSKNFFVMGVNYSC